MVALAAGYLERLFDWCLRWVERRDPIALLVLKTLVLALPSPVVLVLCGWSFDSALGLGGVFPVAVTVDIGFALIIVAWPLFLWSVRTQFDVILNALEFNDRARQLMFSGPYKYCRHPLTLGVLLFYFGIGILFRAATMVFLLVPLSSVLMLYHAKYVKERELELRLGREYSLYKERVPFLFPCFILKRRRL